MAASRAKWSAWVTQYKMAHGCQGQVQPHSRFSEVLYELAREARGILEVGTWEGCGSSLILAKGILDQRAKGARKAVWLQTIEADQARAATARQVLGGLGVVNVTTGAVSLTVDIYPLHAVMHGALPPAMRERDRSEYAQWWRGERGMSARRAASHPVPELCASRAIDVAILDGGEFFGRPDLVEVLCHCDQLRYVALDDTMTFKNYHTRRQMLSGGSGWRLYEEDMYERHGWAVFERNASKSKIKPSAQSCTRQTATCTRVGRQC